jgi:hypothetical protein
MAVDIHDRIITRSLATTVSSVKLGHTHQNEEAIPRGGIQPR